VAWSTGAHDAPPLLCIPGAGASASFFQAWRDLAPGLAVSAIELPAHGNRILEPHLETIEATVEGLLLGCAPLFDRPFALFGHSLGGVLALELARRLCARGTPPAHLFVCSSAAPHRRASVREVLALPPRDFLAFARRIGFVHAAVGREHDEELLRVYLPPLRKDLEMAERWRHAAAPPIDVPITAYAGADDALVATSALGEWSRYGRSLSVRIFPGDHFFPRADGGALLTDIATRLAPQAPVSPPS
jgi:surfactin synthase thioesterase subunit